MLSLDIVRLDLWRGGHLVVRRGPVSSQYTDGYCDGQRRAVTDDAAQALCRL